MVKVVNKKTHKPTDDDVYIGRGSIFGNPFDFRCSNHPQVIYHLDSREKCVESYKFHFLKMLKDDSNFLNGVNDMVEKLKSGGCVNLVCYCAPEKCHGDVIKEYLEESLWNC